MDIRIEHFAGDRPSFNVALASAPGKEPFVTIKGCRIVDGSKGAFVSWPATKNQTSGKYWSHVWASEAFASAVLAKAQETQPRQAPRRAAAPVEDDWDRDTPF